MNQANARREPVIGLTGLPCTGKGEAAAVLASCGAHVIYADRVGHEVLEETDIKAKVRTRFGRAVLTSAGTVDRAALGRIVFADPQALADLEAIVHPRLRDRIRAEAADLRQAKPVAVDAALLVPLGLAEMCDSIVLIESPDALRRQRAIERGWTEEDRQRREARVRQGLDAARRDADFVVQNDSSLEHLQRELAQFWKERYHGNKEIIESR